MAKAPATDSNAITQKSIEPVCTPPTCRQYEKVITSERRYRTALLQVSSGGRILCCAFTLACWWRCLCYPMAAAVLLPSVGLGVGAAYLLSAAVFAYAGFSPEDTAHDVRRGCGGDGSLFLLFGLGWVR